MTANELKELMDVVEGHTPGPWVAHRRDGSYDFERKWDGIGPIGHNKPCGDDDSWVHATEADAALAAAAPALLAELVALKQRLADAPRREAHGAGYSLVEAMVPKAGYYAIVLLEDGE
jgi:hypothetical protein